MKVASIWEERYAYGQQIGKRYHSKLHILEKCLTSSCSKSLWRSGWFPVDRTVRRPPPPPPLLLLEGVADWGTNLHWYNEELSWRHFFVNTPRVFFCYLVGWNTLHCIICLYIKEKSSYLFDCLNLWISSSEESENLGGPLLCWGLSSWKDCVTSGTADWDGGGGGLRTRVRTRLRLPPAAVVEA